MIDLLELYSLAEQHGTEVYWFTMDAAESLSIALGDGSCAIALDPWQLPTLAEEKTKLGHELGHCETGAFYNKYAARDLRQKYENQADKWAIHHLVPEQELIEACFNGCCEIWDLAEHFGVTEDFIKKAICWYTQGDMRSELYF